MSIGVAPLRYPRWQCVASASGSARSSAGIKDSGGRSVVENCPSRACLAVLVGLFSESGMAPAIIDGATLRNRKCKSSACWANCPAALASGFARSAEAKIESARHLSHLVLSIATPATTTITDLSHSRKHQIHFRPIRARSSNTSRTNGTRKDAGRSAISTGLLGSQFALILRRNLCVG